MWRYGPGGGPGWWVLGSILWVAFWVAVVVVIVSLVRGRHHHHHGDQPGPSTPALRVLEERYARGEISQEEFLERRSVLTGQAPPSSPPHANPPPAPPQDPSPTQEL